MATVLLKTQISGCSVSIRLSSLIFQISKADWHVRQRMHLVKKAVKSQISPDKSVFQHDISVWPFPALFARRSGLCFAHLQFGGQ